MKLLAPGIFSMGVLWVTFVPVGAQDQRPVERWACLSSSKCQRSNDAQPETQEFARTAKIGRFWPEEHGNIIATFKADRIESDQGIFRLKGSAEIITTTATLTADEADYHWDTGEIEARGTVRVKPVSYNPGAALRQFGVR